MKPDQRRSAGLALLGFLWVFLAGLASAADPQSGIAAWKRWVPDTKAPAAGASNATVTRAADSWAARKIRAEALEPMAAKWASGPAPLPWIEVTLELVVKYQQNPLRAARVLAHLNAAANDAVIELAPTTTDPVAQAVAVHAAASAVLTQFYPEESPGRLGAMGRGAALASAAKAKRQSAFFDRA